MTFDIASYKPINYQTWAFLGHGLNIKPLLTQLERNIWDKVSQWQDTREDPGQGEVVTWFALELVKDLQGDREIAVPAAIMHDTGWEVNPQEFRQAVAEGRDREMRIKHQVIGVRRAFGTLSVVGYPKEYWGEILAIIADHDTRFSHPRSPNEIAMRDADMLWRFTLPHRLAYLQDKTPAEVAEACFKGLKEFEIYSEAGREIARTETANTLLNITSSVEEARRILGNDFRRYLKRVEDSYSEDK